MEAATRKASRIEFLDAIRGVAALAVVLYHVFSGDSPFLTRWLIQHQNLGSTAVYTFFFVSGFIIPVSMERRSATQFWRSRFFRLYPVYWAAMLVLLLAFWIRKEPLYTGLEHISLKLFLVNLTMLTIPLRQLSVLAQAWTLNIELAFYVICSLLKAAGVLSHRIAVALGAMAIYLLWMLAALLHLIPGQHFKGEWAALLLAAFTGSVFYGVEKKQIRTGTLFYIVPGFLLCACIGTIVESHAQHPPSESMAVSMSLMASWVLATAFFSTMFALRHLQFPTVLLWLGRVSYSLYLVQGIAMYTVKSTHLIPPIAADVATVAAALLLADVFYRLVERPFQGLAKGKPHPPSPAAPILTA
jgi:peptidoglycan/LPS O-acetylase OafA/YrhL